MTCNRYMRFYMNLCNYLDNMQPRPCKLQRNWLHNVQSMHYNWKIHFHHFLRCFHNFHHHLLYHKMK